LKATITDLVDVPQIGIVSAAALTVAFVEATRVVTVAPAVTSYDYIYLGTKVTVSTTKTVTLANTSGLHFVYFSDAAGTLVTSMTPWSLATTVSVAAIYWDAVNAKGLVIEERHGVVMDWATHLRLHEVNGTQVVSGFALSGYTLATDTAAAVTPNVASGVLADEDLHTTVPALTAGTGVYKVWYRNGAAGDWTWTDSDYPVLTGTLTRYNQNTGSAWQLTDVANNSFVNMYLVAVPNTGTQGFAWVMGQASHASLGDAQAETVNNLAFGDLPFTELAALYRLTFQVKSAYTNTSKARLEAVLRIVGSAVTVQQTGINDHAALSNLTAAGAHPATSVSADVTNFNGLLSSADTTVQAALDTLDNVATDLAAKAPLASPTFTGTPTAPTAGQGTNTTQIATTAFVQTEVQNITDPTPNIFMLMGA
jgi:hypothetical protein